MPRIRRTTARVVSRYGLSEEMLRQIDGLLTRGVLPASKKTRAMVNFFIKSRSDTERAWLQSNGNELVADFLAHDSILFAGYEWQSFKLPSGTYTPDWYLMLMTGRRVFVEIKGATQQKNFRDAKSKIRAAATLNPFDIFVLAIRSPKKKDGWTLELVPPDLNYLINLHGNFKEFYSDAQDS